MVPTIDELERYFDYVEHVVADALAAASPELPNFQEALNRLWLDISRFGPHRLPSLPDIHVPGLGVFEIPPPPPPPPPPPKSWIENAADCVVQHPWITSGVIVSALGAGLLVGYTVIGKRPSTRRRGDIPSSQPEKRHAIVILGGDHPLGLPLITGLEKQGYIVIASVSSPEAVDGIESKGRGYVRALVLDPNEPGTIPIFLRSLASTLSRRFPLTATGDPYAPTSHHPLVHSVISLLTMPNTAAYCTPAPFEQISLRSTYLPHLLSTHIAPLQTIQALLPLLRADATRARGQKSIILCLPAADARVGLPFGSVSAMSAAATVRAADVLRREIAATHRTNAIRIVTVDVGEVGSSTRDAGFKVNMDGWTPSEKATYGAAFGTLSNTRGSRVPTDVSAFVDSLITVASAGAHATCSGRFIFGLDVGLWCERVRDWIRGDRFSIGAGAGTYAFASHLPSALLDRLLVLPHLLVDIRNRLLSIPTSRNDSVNLMDPIPHAESSPGAGIDYSTLRRPIERPRTTVATPEPRAADEQSINSDVDLESNDGDLESTGVGSSWVSLGPREPSE